LYHYNPLAGHIALAPVTKGVIGSGAGTLGTYAPRRADPVVADGKEAAKVSALGTAILTSRFSFAAFDVFDL
jgi:hypothetical protein